MSKKKKRLLRMRRNKKNVRFDELISVLEDHGFSVRYGKGSHVIAKCPMNTGTLKVTFVKPHTSKFVKANYVISVLKVIDKIMAEQASEDEDDGRED